MSNYYWASTDSGLDKSFVMRDLQTPQEFLFSIAGMKMLEAEMALIRYIELQRQDAIAPKAKGKNT